MPVCKAPSGYPSCFLQSLQWYFNSIGRGFLTNSSYSVSDHFLSIYRLPDGLTRRGDINLLMMGDPGTAKSQLLKFVERCSPIGVSNL